jgi:hypothetical protein
LLDDLSVTEAAGHRAESDASHAVSVPPEAAVVPGGSAPLGTSSLATSTASTAMTVVEVIECTFRQMGTAKYTQS